MKSKGPISSGLLFLLLIFLLVSCFPCFGPTNESAYSSGYTRIKNNTNDLIRVYFDNFGENIFLDTLRPQQSIKYQFIVPINSNYLYIKKENNTLITTGVFLSKNKIKKMSENEPQFLGLVNDSTGYIYFLKPLHINEPTTDSIIIFGDTENDLNLESRNWVIIKGSVIDSVTGNGIIGSTVIIRRDQIWSGVSITNFAGDYQIHIDYSGELNIEAFHPGYDTSYTRISTTIGETTWINFSLQPTGIINENYGILTGKVVNAITKRGFRDATITLYNTDLGTMTEWFGRYVIYNIPVGSYKVVVASFIGYDQDIDSNVVIKPNQTTIRNFQLKELKLIIPGDF